MKKKMLLKENRYTHEGGVYHTWAFHCPGCGHLHVYHTEHPRGHTWNFNGDLEKPTFTPSLLNTAPDHANPKQRRCHLFVTNGNIVYCGDCTHDYAGKTIPMVDYFTSESS